MVFNPEKSKKHGKLLINVVVKTSSKLKGQVVYRDKEAINPKMKTGEFEVMATDITILNTAKTTPFTIEDDNNVNDELRMKYRYLDLRRPSMTNNIKLRHQVTKTIRHYLDNHDF